MKLTKKLSKSEDVDKKKKNRYRQLSKLQNILSLHFKNQSLLNRALIHSSFLNESNEHVKDNERLEYLGDSVLGLVVNEYLFKHFEMYHEGDLAKIKSVVVSETVLAKIAVKLDIGGFLLMGKGEELNGGRLRQSILADTFEAIIGASYLDLGLKETKNFILRHLKDEIERTDSLTYQRDPKTTLQEYVQKKFKNRPVYEVIKEIGPDHDKQFVVRLLINEIECAIGEGPSKQKAERNAANAALNDIEEGKFQI